MNKKYFPLLLITVYCLLQSINLHSAYKTRPNLENLLPAYGANQKLKRSVVSNNPQEVLECIKEGIKNNYPWDLEELPTIACRNYVSAKTPYEKYKAKLIITSLLRLHANFNKTIKTNLPPSKFIGIPEIIEDYTKEEATAATALIFEKRKNITLITSMTALLESEL